MLDRTVRCNCSVGDNIQIVSEESLTKAVSPTEAQVVQVYEQPLVWQKQVLTQHVYQSFSQHEVTPSQRRYVG